MTDFRITLLGPVGIRAGDRRCDLGPPKERSALAALAWDAGRPVSVDTLTRRIWDEDLPDEPRNALRSYLSRIRKTLYEVGGDAAPALTNRTHTYALEADPDTVDLCHYLRLIEQSHTLHAAGETGRALLALEEAAGVWGGEPLAGLGGSWAEHVRATAAEKRVAATVLRAEITLSQGRFADSIAELRPLAEYSPLDESVAGLLAVALYGCGRGSEATRLLQHTRRALLRELGAEPGEELRRIHEGILNHAPAASLLPAAARSPEPPADLQSLPAPAVPDNLPRDVSWVGRRDELRRLVEALPGPSPGPEPVGRLEAIDGMPGVGKTSLAVHAAYQLHERYPDGRILVDLRGHAPGQPPLTPAAALSELLRHLGTPTEAIPQDLARLTAYWRSAVRDRRAVIILDDAAGVEQVAPLLPGTSSSLVIVTSRRRLTGLPDVRPVSLDVLPQNDAVALLRRRIGDDRAPTPVQAAHITRLCNHIPFAIELVAGRFLSRPSWKVSDLLERLSARTARIPEIRDGDKAMAQAIELSYRTLSPTGQQAFRRLGLHIGPEFSPEAATALTGFPPAETDRVLDELFTCHLVFEASADRYRMHDLLREYATSLADEYEDRSTVRRLADHYLRSADRADRQLFSFRVRIDMPEDAAAGACRTEHARAHTGGYAAAQQWFVTEGPNLLAVLDHTRAQGTPERLALFTHVLASFLDTEGYLATALPLLRQSVHHWRGTDDRHALVRALLDLASVCGHAGDCEEAEQAAYEALELGRALHESEAEAEALHQLAIAYWRTGRYQEGLSRLRGAIRLRSREEQRVQQARSFNLLGIMLLHLDRDSESSTAFAEALTRFREIEDLRGQFRTLNNIGEIQQKTGDLVAAERAYREAMTLSRRTGSQSEFATLQMNLAGTLRSAGRIGEALHLYREALPPLRSAGDLHSEAIIQHGIGSSLHRAGRHEEALPHHAAALKLTRKIGAAHEEAQVLRDLGRAEAATGRCARAAEHLAAALAAARRLGAHSQEAEALRALAEFHDDGGSAVEARQLRDQARALSAEPGGPESG
ncbi:tetratricopeptide repeat protein [Streptomyces sp. ODS28]|uniref:AfsR/SARP family transcriptional regulator n=1 Tax=Streptomyces sp. ODS28 TaxID=3136688 RepID=UPI0031ECFA4E